MNLGRLPPTTAVERIWQSEYDGSEQLAKSRTDHEDPEPQQFVLAFSAAYGGNSARLHI